MLFSFESGGATDSALGCGDGCGGCDIGEKKDVMEPFRSDGREVTESPLVASLRASSTIFEVVVGDSLSVERH